MRPGRPRTVDPARPRRMLQPDGSVVRRAQIDDAELNALRAADEARDAALRPFGASGVRRLKLYVIGSMVGFPLASWVLSSVGFGVLWFQLLLAVAYGTFVALVRPGMVLCAAATMAVPVLVHTVYRMSGGPSPTFYLLLTLIGYAGFGAVLGFRENDRQGDR